jgi:magnesium transporter
LGGVTGANRTGQEPSYRFFSPPQGTRVRMKVTARTRRELARRRARLFARRYHPPGTAPGTLLPTHGEPAAVRALHYLPGGTQIRDALPAKLPNADAGPLWVHVAGEPTREQLTALGELLGLHPLVLEDIQNHGQRPKLDSYDNGLFIALSAPMLRGDEVVAAEFSVFLGKGFALSVYEAADSPLRGLEPRIEAQRGRPYAQSAEYLAYVTADLVIDSAFPVLEALGDRLEAVEEALLDRPRQAHLRTLHDLRRSLLVLRRSLWPARDVLARLTREETPYTGAALRPFWQDVYDHLVQLIELTESYRELATSLTELYLSAQNRELNEVMRLLTVIATIFIPLTFIVGVYGMNFTVNETSRWAMPELHWDYGYPVLWVVMIGIGGGMAWYFRRRGWF